jgi:hypothetical protein
MGGKEVLGASLGVAVEGAVAAALVDVLGGVLISLACSAAGAGFAISAVVGCVGSMGVAAALSLAMAVSTARAGAVTDVLSDDFV